MDQKHILREMPKLKSDWVDKSLNWYQEQTVTTAIYPEVGTGSVSAIEYCALGLAGEAGEVANKVKKIIRDGDSKELRSGVLKEMGGVLWYLSQLALELGYELTHVAYENVTELQGRRERGTLHGSGDNR